MNVPETVGTTNDISTGPDALYVKQLNDVDKMRSCLLSCNDKDSASATRALQNITILRVYHQIARIIRFTEMLDKLEDKMYQSIDSTLQTMNPDDATTWSTLMRMQSQLQTTMIESQKLLDPYLKSELFTSVIIDEPESPKSFASMMLEPDSRQKIRESASAVLAAIESAETADNS